LAVVSQHQSRRNVTVSGASALSHLLSTHVIVVTSNWLFLSMCLIISLPVSIRQPDPSLCSFDSLHSHSTPVTSPSCVDSPLIVHSSLTLSLPAQNLPVSQVLPTVHSLLPSELTPQTFTWTVSSELYRFLWPPYLIGQAIIFLPCGFFFYLSIFLPPPIISAVADWMSAILPHMVWP